MADRQSHGMFMFLSILRPYDGLRSALPPPAYPARASLLSLSVYPTAILSVLARSYRVPPERAGKGHYGRGQFA